MHYLIIRDLHKSFSHKVVFGGLDMTIHAGQKIALVGANGSGKTTLIRTIMGEADYHQGSIERSDKIHVGRLRQEAVFDPTSLVIDILFADDTPRAKAIKQYEQIMAHDEFDEQAFADVNHQIDQLDAWSYEARVRSIISQLQLTPFLEQSFGSLSGGEAKRIALAKVLIEDPQMLILDEPTNHLDVTMIEWLEDYIARYDLTLLMVTHDRYFLDRVCTDIYELYDGQITTYPGSYRHYLYAKSERDTAADDLLHQTKQLYRKELQWMRTSPRARQTKSVDRQKKFYNIEKDYKEQRKTAKLRRQGLELATNTSRLGGKIIKTENISKSYGDKCLVDGFSYQFQQGERIGIVGPNGVGKSTFIHLLLGQVEPDSGHIITGKTVVFGHYLQEQQEFDGNKKVLDIVKDVAPYIRQADGKKISATKLLEQFMFTPRQQHSFAKHLSGGERRRLTLLLVLLQNPNFLILDEPTNDLDIDSVQVLEQFLLSYTGCLIVISHDRFFMDKIVDHLFVFEGQGKISDYRGSYSEYKKDKDTTDSIEKVEEIDQGEGKSTSSAGSSQKKLSYMDQREYDALGPAIEALEAEKDEINGIFQHPDTDHETLTRLGKRMNQLLEELEEKETRWLELMEKIN